LGGSGVPPARGIPPAILFFLALEVGVGLLVLSLPATYVLLLLVVSAVAFVCLFYPIYGYCLAIIILPFSGVTIFNIGKADFRIADVIIVLTFFGWLWTSINRRHLRFASSVLNAPIILLFLWMLLSLTWTISLQWSAFHLLKIFYGLVFFFLSLSLIQDRKTFHLVLWMWVLSGMIMVFVGLFELVKTGLPSARLLQDTATITHWGNPVRTAAYREGPNRFGFFLNLCIMLTFPMLLLPRSKKLVITLYLSLALMTVVMLTSLSRAAWLAFAAGSFVLALRSKRLAKLFVVIVLGVVVLYAVVSTSAYSHAFFQRFLTLLSPPEEQITGRVANWKASFDILRNSPLLGIGVGSYPVIKGNAPHNLYLDTVTGLGVVGFTFFVVAIIRLISYIRRFMKLSVDQIDRFLVWGLCAGLVVYLVQGLFTSFRLKELEMWAYLGLTIAGMRVFSKEVETFRVEQETEDRGTRSA
jgi:O-antigen ligase